MYRWITLSLLLSLPLNAQELIFSSGFENTPPVIVSSPVTDGEVDTAYAYDVDATDANGDLLAYYLLVSPEGMDIDAVTGEISWTPAKAGDFAVTVEVADGQRGYASQSWVIAVSPPNPADIAPENNPEISTTIFHSTEFLYSGEGAIQSGVEEGTIDPAFAAVIRGKVMTRDGAALPGVTITILDHAEYGQTVSRGDGAFDMVVNGGGQLILNYTASAFLPSQRQIHLPWQDYVFAPDVALVPLDPVVTTIDLAAATEMIVAQGSVQNDANGDRQATILFPLGTQAELIMPDGSSQVISSLDVRATEYTVGENGPEAMPGELPPTSGYTYAVELSVDQALIAGATMVSFDQPLPFYVENFLGFPTGITVPSGYYDRGEAKWVPSDNGLIIEILGINGGMADLDVAGEGVIADAETLSALDISDAEREHLANLYQAGDSLWRVPIPHFTPWDHNWPYGPPLDAEFPDMPLPKDAGELVDGACEGPGSIIECQNQVLGERIPITGTGFTLNYRSSRQKGFTAQNSASIPLTGDSLPASVERVEVKMTVAGQSIVETFAPATNITHDFEWNGEDAYGRPAFGSQKLTGTISYIYPLVYQEPDDFAYAFARLSGVTMAGFFDSRLGGELPLSQTFSLELGTPPRGSAPIAGWSLNVHHLFDPVGRILYLGDGARSQSDTLKLDAVSTWCQYTNHYTFGPDGSLYYADKCNDSGNYSSGNAYRIHRQWPNGEVTVVAGGGGLKYDNGIPATDARITSVRDIEIASDGSVYYFDFSECQIRRITTGGLIYTVMNQGGANDCRHDSEPFDAGDALQYGFRSHDFLLTGDGRIILTAYEKHRVIQIDSDGYFSSFAGNRNPEGVQGGYRCGLNEPLLTGEGGPASQAGFCWPLFVASDREGNVYFTVPGAILKVDPHGQLSRAAGYPNSGPVNYDGDGGPAVDANIGVNDLAHLADGTLYFVENARIRVVYPDGIINTLAGGESQIPETGLGGPARAAKFSQLDDMAVSPEGNLHFRSGDGFRRIAPVFPTYDGIDISLPSSDGSLVYQFNDEGRHLRTVSSLTGVIFYDFAYDNDGRLISVTDVDGNITSIHRNGAGEPTSIVGPFGAQTTLSVDENGFLSSITNPASESMGFQYSSEGLLERVTDPLGHFSEYAYDVAGRLELATNRDGHSQTILRVSFENGFEIANSTAEGRETRYRIERNINDDLLAMNTFPGGMAHEGVAGSAGQSSVITGYGVERSITNNPDPRFGMFTPLRGASSETTPGGVSRDRAEERSYVLNDPNDPLSVQSVTQVVSLEGRVTSLSYDAASSTIVKTTPTGRQTVTTLDAAQRPTSVSPAGLGQTSYSYDELGRVTQTTMGDGIALRAIQTSYDGSGRLDSVTNALSELFTFEYDDANRPTRLLLPDSRDIEVSYDAAGRLTLLTTPTGAEHEYIYSPSGLLQEYRPPAVTGGGNPVYSYDQDGLLSGWARGDGQTVSLVYDAGVRLSEQQTPSGTFMYSYDSANRVSGLTTPGGINLAYTYDGDLMLDETWSGPVTGSVSRSYRDDFAISGFTVNGQDSFSLDYTDEGALSTAGDLLLTRDAASSLLTGTTLGQVTEEFTSNQFGELESHIARYDGTAIFEASYEYDKLGRVNSRTETVGGVTTVYGYVYDSTGRLINVSEDEATTETYVYDANNNVTGFNEAAATYNARDWVLTLDAASFSHSADGERISRTDAEGTRVYNYDALGNLVGVNLPDGRTVDYLVDGHGRRVGKKVDGVYLSGFLYLDDRSPIAEVDVNGDVTTLFVYGAGFAIPSYLVRGGTTYRIITDHLESVRLVVNIDTGSIVQRLDYNAWGDVILDTNPGFQPFAFAGGLLDPDTGLTRLGKRDYDAETARWTTPDPLGLGPGFNVYAYVGNNPVSKNDPLGLSPDMQGMCSATAEEGQCTASRRDLGKSSVESVDDILSSSYRQDDGRLAVNPTYTHRNDKCSVTGNLSSGAVGKPGSDQRHTNGFWANCNYGQSCLGGYRMVQIGRFEVIGCFPNEGPIVTREYEGLKKMCRWWGTSLSFLCSGPVLYLSPDNCVNGVRG